MLRLPNEYITDPRVRADFDSFCNAATPQEKQKIIERNKQWMASLSPEQRTEAYAVMRRSAEEMVAAALANLDELDRKYAQ